MKITGTKAYCDITEVDGGRTARFAGELGIDGFYAVKSTMIWLGEQKLPTDADRDDIVKKVKDVLCNNPEKVKVYFL